MMERTRPAGGIDLTLGELAYLYLRLKAGDYLRDPDGSSAYRKLEERLFSFLSIQEVLDLEAEGRGGQV